MVAAIAPSSFREVFTTTPAMKEEFVKFLQTIFYQLDEKKVLAAMEELLADPNRTDEQIYTALLESMGSLKKQFAPLLQLWSLRVVKKGMGEQAQELLKPFDKELLKDYAEIYNRRYAKVLGIPLSGRTIAVADTDAISLSSRIEAGALFSSFPYTQHVPLNDADCADPALEPEKTAKPLGDEIPDQSLDLIGCLGGLHHIPEERVEPLVASLHRKLRPGAVLLLRDHDAANPEVTAIASVVHTFVNAANGVSWEAERKEIRNFKPLAEWIALLEAHGFSKLPAAPKVLKDDPTQNSMIAFVKTPQTLEELRQLAHYRADCTRPSDGTAATWIEWGNVRSSKQYAEFVQNHHSYAFDYIGHLRQHWQHCYHYLKESIHDGASLKKVIFSDNFMMNVFILFSATLQCLVGWTTSLPSQLVARWRHGHDWRWVANLTKLERYEAQVEMEYCNFIDHTPFYMFDYLGKISGVWNAVAKERGWLQKFSSGFNALFSSASLLAKAAISAPVRLLYTAEQNKEPDLVSILVKDPQNHIREGQLISQTPDGHKLLLVPRYRPFTELCRRLSDDPSVELFEVGNQKTISVDVRLGQLEQTVQPVGSRLVYKMGKLQDAGGDRYATYQVAVEALQTFTKFFDPYRIEYVHE